MANKVFKGVKSTLLPDTYVNSPESVAPLFSASTAYAKGDQVYNGLKLYRFTANHAAGAWTGSDVEEVTVGGQLKTLNEDTTELKQDLQEFPNGNYPNMTAGNAEQLVSTVFVEDEVPYNFRTSGGSADIGDREYDEIVGVSMPINQIIPNANKDFSKEFTGDTPYNYNAYSNLHIPVNAGHKCFVSTSVTRNIATNNRVGIDLWQNNPFTYLGGVSMANGSPNGTVSGVFSVPNGVSYLDIVMINNYSGKQGYEAGDSVSFDNFMVFDLTLLLGTTIADYVYGLEQSTAGSGVAWLKHHFPKIFDSGYIPYNAGEIQSVTGLSAHKMTGFNQWDEQWEVGGLNEATGLPTVDARIRSKNFIPVVPGTTYYALDPTNGNNLRIYYYDANEAFIGISSWLSGSFTTPQNCAFVKFHTATSYGTTYKNDICINLHWDGERDGQYEAYKEYEYALDDSVVLRGKLELDSNNNLRANGDRYLPDGSLDRRYGEVDLGTINWVKGNALSSGDGYVYYITADTTLGFKSNGKIVCTLNIHPGSAENWESISVGEIYRANNYIVVGVNATTVSGAKTALSGKILVYEKATATTETSEPYQTPQIVDDWGTEEYVSTSLVPVGHDTKYANNLRAKLEMAPNSPDDDGDYLVRQTNGQNEYVAYVSPVPASPTANGTYTLKATVSSGTVTLSWVADS